MSVPRLPVHRDAAVTVFLGDARDVLAELPAASLDCCITSPPYWGLRDYRLPPVAWGGDPDCRHRWGGTERGRGDLLPAYVNGLTSRIGITTAGGSAALNRVRFRRRCGAWLGSLGLEPSPELYVVHLVEVMRQMHRVLKPGGSLWLNLGDSYAGNGTPAKHLGLDASSADHARGGAHKQEGAGVLRRRVTTGLKAKDLVGVPWRVAFALQSDGWYLRSDVIWAKPNLLSRLVRDRPTHGHGCLFLLAPSSRYFYDAEAMREPCASGPSDVRKTLEGLPRLGGKHKNLQDRLARANATANIGRRRSVGDPSGRNRRSVWTIASQPCHGAHFATFPAQPVEPCVLAGTGAHGCCPSCGARWERGSRLLTGVRPATAESPSRCQPCSWTPLRAPGPLWPRPPNIGRRAIWVELNPNYLELIRQRRADVASNLTTEEAA